MAAVPGAAAVPKTGGEEEYVSVARRGEVDPGRGRVVFVRGREIALFNVDGEFFAVDNLCPHEGGPLVAGAIKGAVVTCPWHQWKFDLGTGCSPVNPAVRVQTYQVKVEGDQVKVGVPAV